MYLCNYVCMYVSVYMCISVVAVQFIPVHHHLGAVLPAHTPWLRLPEINGVVLQSTRSHLRNGSHWMATATRRKISPNGTDHSITRSGTSRPH